VSEKYTFHYNKFGQGEKSLIFLHGFAERKEMWDEFCEKLQIQIPDFSIYALDIPGFGECPLFSSIKQLSDVSEYLSDFMRSLNIEKAHFAGHSMGGYILVDFVIKHSEKTQSICLINSQIFSDSNDKKAIRDRTIKFISIYGANKFVKSFFPELFADKEKNKAPLDKMIHLGNTIQKESLIAYMNFMRDRPDQSKELTDIEIPFHFLIGKKDLSIPYDISLKQISIPQKSTAIVFNTSAHMLVFENQIDSILSICYFLENHL
jgi:pimeloyl-ACP methyl ester carboxylesterase